MTALQNAFSVDAVVSGAADIMTSPLGLIVIACGLGPVVAMKGIALLNAVLK